MPWWKGSGSTMNKLSALIVLSFGVCFSASADIWRWVDPQGKIHYVDSNTPIWTWVGADGLVYYSDIPESRSAVRVALQWHATGQLTAQTQSRDDDLSKTAQTSDPNESDEDRQEREMAEAYYCKEAKKIFDTYSSAPRLYRTSEAGEREYLSDEEMSAKLSETEAKVAELCG